MLLFTFYFGHVTSEGDGRQDRILQILHTRVSPAVVLVYISYFSYFTALVLRNQLRGVVAKIWEVVIAPFWFHHDVRG